MRTVEPAPTPETIAAGAVVVGVDGSSAAERAALWAAAVAHREDRPLVLVEATTGSSQWLLPPIGSEAVDGEPATTDEQAVVLAARRVLDVTDVLGENRLPEDRLLAMCVPGEPEDVLVALSEHAHVLVVGSRAHGRVRSALLGSVSTALVRRTRCPLVVLPAAVGPEGRGVVVGIDGTAESVPTADFAFRAASWRDEPLTAVHCFWEPDQSTGVALVARPHSDLAAERMLVSETVAGLSERYPDVDVHVELDRGLAEDVLAELSHDAGLVVVGTHAHGALSEMALGSIASAVVQHGHCPIAVVPHAPSLHAVPAPSRHES